MRSFGIVRIMKRLIHNKNQKEGNMSTNNDVARKKKLLSSFSNLIPDRAKNAEFDADFTLSESEDGEFNVFDMDGSNSHNGKGHSKDQKLSESEAPRKPS